MPNSYSSSKDPNAATARSPEGPAAIALAVSTSDTADLAVYCKAIRVFVPSSLEKASVRVTPVMSDDDANIVTLSFPSGLSYEPLSVRRVWTTGTTAGIEIHGYTV